MDEKKHQYQTVKEYKVGEVVKVLLNKMGDNPIQVNIVRVGKSGKVKAARAFMALEWPLLAEIMPKVQKDLDADTKKVVAAIEKAKGNGGKKKETKATKAADKPLVKDPKKKGTTTKKAGAGKKAAGKTTERKVITRKAADRKKKDASIDDLL
jgi:hypothetical protein